MPMKIHSLTCMAALLTNKYPARIWRCLLESPEFTNPTLNLRGSWSFVINVAYCSTRMTNATICQFDFDQSCFTSAAIVTYTNADRHNSIRQSKANAL